MFGVAVTEDRAVSSKVLYDANWDVEFEDLPARNGRAQLLYFKCS